MPLIWAIPGLDASASEIPSQVTETTLLELPDVVGWFDATSAAHRTVVGGKVTQCIDRISGTALVQATDAKQLALEVGTLNGEDCFVGSGGQYLRGPMPDSYPNGTNQGWMFAVVEGRDDVGDSVRTIASAGTNQPAAAGRYLRHTGAGRFQGYSGNFLNDGGHNVSLGRHVLAARWFSAGDAIQGFVDGEPSKPPSQAGIAFNTVKDRITLGADLAGNPDTAMRAAVSHLVFTQGLAPGPRDAVMSWCLWKAGRQR